MPVEINGLIIKTEIRSVMDNARKGMTKAELNTIKKRLLKRCKELLKQRSKKIHYRR